MARILVVEDSPLQAKWLSMALVDAGFEAETAPDAEEGLARLTQGGVDAVLSDLNLPGDSGFDLCRQVRSNPAMASMPIVICTAEADPLNVLRGLEAGADGFVIKDREPSEIIASIRRVLDRSAPSGPQPPIPIHFLGQKFVLSASREQFADILVMAFEDVVHLHRRALNAARSEAEAHAALLVSHQELKWAETQLVQAEKLSSLGQMVAGVAHEINNPLAFVLNNVEVLRRDVASLLELIQIYHDAEQGPAETRAETLGRARDLAEAFDLDYTRENSGGLLDRSREGLKRIQSIVANLRDFARLDDSELKEVDLNNDLASTLEVIRFKADCRGVSLEADLGPLPRVTCFPAKINQAVLNLLANAIDACDSGGRVVLSSRPSPCGTGVEISCTDTGAGIIEDVRDKIFDPFFTTKPIGQGVGLGLSISYGIVQSHGGRIDFETEPGRGSRFVVHLPASPIKAECPAWTNPHRISPTGREDDPQETPVSARNDSLA